MKPFLHRWTTFLAAFVLAITLVTPALAQRGSFGRGGGFGGGRSYGGSFGGRSSGGGFFGRSSGGFGGSRRPSSGGFFGNRPRSSGTATMPRSGSGSFGRSGGFGSSGRVNSTSLNGRYVPPAYRSYGSPSYSGYANYGGSSVPAFGFGFLGGYSLGILSNPWTHWMPFHPAFYVNPPMYSNGAYYGGGFIFTRLIIGAVILWLIWSVVSRLFRGSGRGGGQEYRYTIRR